MVQTEVEISFDEAIVVESVAQEYEIVSRRRCDCGGALKLKCQNLLVYQSGHYDLIEAQCEACHKPHHILFDVSGLFNTDTEDTE